MRVDQPRDLPNYGYLGLDLRDDPAAVEVVTEAIAQAERPEVLRVADQALRAGRARAAWSTSLIALDHAEQPHEIRRSVLEALGRIGTDESLEPPHADRRAARRATASSPIRNIGRMRSATPEARARLVESVGRRRHAARRSEARAAPRSRPSATSARSTALARARRRARQRRRGPGPRRDVRPRLDRRAGAPARPASHRPLRHRGDARMQKQVAVALGGMGGEDARSALEQMLTNERPRRRRPPLRPHGAPAPQDGRDRGVARPAARRRRARRSAAGSSDPASDVGRSSRTFEGS